MTYQEYEKGVFDWLLAKHKADNNFRFSVRKKRNKGSESDYFIGTEKSGYFATSFWFIPAPYRGASIDPVVLIFSIGKSGELSYKWQFHVASNSDQDQSQVCHKMLQKAATTLQEDPTFLDRFSMNDGSKVFTARISGRESAYDSITNLVKDVESDMPAFTNAVEKSISTIKNNNPSFIADRIDEQEFLDSIEKLNERVSFLPNKSSKKDPTNPTMSKRSLNQILFGPPGTGKTYHTIDMAVEIVDGVKGTHHENKGRYDELVKSGQIQFVTFHQSMSYEDFVEGIKPVIDEAVDSEKREFLEYEVAPGIFKRICQSARTVKAVQKKVDWDNPRYFKMSLGGKSRPDIHEWCLENSVIGLGWGGEEDLLAFKGLLDWEKYRDKFKKTYPALVNESRYNIQSTYAFLNSMNEGDIVVASMGNHVIDAIGVVTGDYYYDDGEQIEFFHFRKVDWIVKGMGSSPEKFFRKQISQQSIYEFDKSDIIYESFRAITASEKEDSGAKPYVLIIDEINRGNVSQIFGELITLLEEDKREGEDNAITVKLPYSKKDFSVPANLYVLGTMNTADRSVEALDSALRRRFSFIEMPPESRLLSPGACFCRLLWKYEFVEWEELEYKFPEDQMQELLGPSNELWSKRKDLWEKMKKEGGPSEDQWEYFPASEFSKFNLQVILDTLNVRIEKLVDRDHLIGHSYFMNVVSIDDLRLAFKDKVIPLLQEYFYGNYDRLRMVLGEGFVKKKIEEVEFALKDMDDDLESRPVFSLSKEALMNNDVFKEALKSFLPKKKVAEPIDRENAEA